MGRSSLRGEKEPPRKKDLFEHHIKEGPTPLIPYGVPDTRQRDASRSRQAGSGMRTQVPSIVSWNRPSDSHTQSLGRTQAVALSVSANLLEGARSLLIVGVLVRLYIRDFYLVLLGLFGVRDEDED